jgi:hypothetical protein
MRRQLSIINGDRHVELILDERERITIAVSSESQNGSGLYVDRAYEVRLGRGNGLRILETVRPGEVAEILDQGYCMR